MSRFKEPVIWAMIATACILAMVLVLRYKDKIDGYKLTTVRWLGSISYYSPDIPGDNMTVWGGKIIGTQVIDSTVEVGLDANGFLRWRKAEGKKEWQETSAFKPHPGPWQDMKRGGDAQ